MRCPSCDHDNRTDRRFCAECGARSPLHVPRVVLRTEPGEKFCGGCGAALTVGPVTGPIRPPAASTPKHLAEKILQSQSALEGERKQVTVLFADVKGSMELAEQLDPEEWSQIMQRFFQILAEGVERFEGFVDKFTGDGIMALFGAPIAHEDHARRACYAALHLRDGLRRLRQRAAPARAALNFSARMGLNSGEVIVGKIGDDLRMDYTAQGHTVGLAARMEQIAEPGKVLPHGAHRAAGRRATSRSPISGEMEIKGVARADARATSCRGSGRSRTRLDVSRSRGFSRFVGRGDEMHVLESALARAREGNAQVVGIVGDAGLGKSRLCFEFLERCRARGLMTYETTGVAHGKAIPVPADPAAVSRLLRHHRAGQRRHRARAHRRPPAAARRAPAREPAAELRLHGRIPIPRTRRRSMDPEARQRQMFDIVRRVIQARGQKETPGHPARGPALVRRRQRRVSRAADRGRRGDARPGAAQLPPRVSRRRGWASRTTTNCRSRRSAPTPSASCSMRCSATIPASTGLAEAIHARTAGNPFFTEEVVQNLIESGKLQGSQGRLSTGHPGRQAGGAELRARAAGGAHRSAGGSARRTCCRPPR